MVSSRLAWAIGDPIQENNNKHQRKEKGRKEGKGRKEDNTTLVTVVIRRENEDFLYPVPGVVVHTLNPTPSRQAGRYL